MAGNGMQTMQNREEAFPGQPSEAVPALRNAAEQRVGVFLRQPSRGEAPRTYRGLDMHVPPPFCYSSFQRLPPRSHFQPCDLLVKPGGFSGKQGLQGPT